jgi:hypothetical protein
MSQRSNYWSCSPFADWLRGTPKLDAATSEGWDNWRTEAKKKHPVRYWIAEEGLDKVQNFLWWPIDKIYDVKYYVNNRWVTRTHALTAHPRDIPPGEWRDVGNRFLPCLFNELVDFVEVELAWWHLAWGSKEERDKYNMPWWAAGWWRVRSWRCPQAGLDNLNWQMNLKADDSWGLKEGDKGYGELTPQAINAREIYELYKWWTEVYRNRPDPHDASGWTEYCELKRQECDSNGSSFFNESKDPKLVKMRDKALKLCHKIEQQYEKEDEQMLIRLIKVRNSLWT